MNSINSEVKCKYACTTRTRLQSCEMSKGFDLILKTFFFILAKKTAEFMTIIWIWIESCFLIRFHCYILHSKPLVKSRDCWQFRIVLIWFFSLVCFIGWHIPCIPILRWHFFVRNSFAVVIVVVTVVLIVARVVVAFVAVAVRTL